MGLLVRFGNDAHVFEVIVVPFVGKHVLRPSQLHDLEILHEPLPALRVGDVIAVVGPREPAAADTQVQPPLADVVDGCDFLGHPHRVAQRKHQYGGPHADSVGPGGDGGSEDEGRGHNGRDGPAATGGREVPFGQPYPVKTPLLSVGGGGEGLLKRLALSAPLPIVALHH